MRLLALDPGLQHFGCALFNDDLQLHAAALVRAKKSPHTVAGAFEMKSLVQSWLFQQGVHEMLQVVCEVPRIYPAKNRRGDLNDLITLAGFAYAVSGLSSFMPLQYFPRDWKGTIDPDVCNARVLARLSKVEQERIEPCPASLRHNVLDAIGIGLFHLDRFDPRRVYPGAT